MLDENNHELHNRDAEIAVLNAMFNDGSIIFDVVSNLKSGDFYFFFNQQIFECIERIYPNKNTPVNKINLEHFLAGKVDTEYLDFITDSPLYLDSLDSHVSCIKEMSTRRKLKIAGSRILEMSSDPSTYGYLDELSSQAQKVFSGAISDAGESNSTSSTYLDLTPDFLINLKNRAETKGGVTGLATGFQELDDLTCGLQDADLIIIAGRPSMGKSTIAMNMMEAIAQTGKRCLVFSMEMPSDSILTRSVASLGSIDATRLRTGKLTTVETEQLSPTLEIIKKLPIIVEEKPALSIQALTAKAHRENAKSELGAVLVDYIQLMGSTKQNNSNRNAQIEEITRGLKQLAKDLKIPVIALSQLSRDVDKRPNKRPVNSDLRDSGSIEQDADVVMFIYRDEVYNPDTTKKGIAEIIIGKQRNGPLGTVRTEFQGRFNRFRDIGGI